MQRELAGLPPGLAELIGKHIAAAFQLLDEDPKAALEHARFMRSRAARVAVVREAAGVVAYQAEEWAEALSELRTARRLGGGPGLLAIMADCERALGRPERALDLARSPEARQLDAEEAAELRIVAAGARRDLGQDEAAVVGLQGPDLDERRRDPWSARLFYAYADNLEAVGRTEEATQWFIAAADADEDGETDASERAAALGNAELDSAEARDGSSRDDVPPALADASGVGSADTGIGRSSESGSRSEDDSAEAGARDADTESASADSMQGMTGSDDRRGSGAGNGDAERGGIPEIDAESSAVASAGADSDVAGSGGSDHGAAADAQSGGVQTAASADVQSSGVPSGDADGGDASSTENTSDAESSGVTSADAESGDTRSGDADGSDASSAENTGDAGSSGVTNGADGGDAINAENTSDAESRGVTSGAGAESGAPTGDAQRVPDDSGEGSGVQGAAEASGDDVAVAASSERSRAGFLPAFLEPHASTGSADDSSDSDDSADSADSAEEGRRS